MPHRLSLTEIQTKHAAGQLTQEDLVALAADPRVGVQRFLRQLQASKDKLAREEERLGDLTQFERQLWSQGVTKIAGIDEVGAGTLAGPVTAAAVVLPVGLTLPGVDDSKRLTRKQREALSHTIKANAIAWAIGSCSAEEIDHLNILQAGREAMRRAVVQLETVPDYLLVDARHVPAVGIKQRAIDGGDRRSQSIAAASIVAKVERDAQMAMWAERYPGYGFEQHWGYSTAEHLEALQRLGPSPLHRRSFAPVRAVLVGMRPNKPKQLRLC